MHVSRILQIGVLAAALVLGAPAVAASAAPTGSVVQEAQDVELFSGSAVSPVLVHALALAEANARASAADAGYTDNDCAVKSRQVRTGFPDPSRLTYFALVTIGCTHA